MANKQKPKLLSDKDLNTIRGKCLVGAQSKEEIFAVLGHIDALEMKLDELDDDDYFGTEGWRHSFDHPDAD